MTHFHVGNALVVPRSRQQIHEESKDIKGENKGDDPFQDGPDGPVGGERGADKDSSKEDFDNDEEELHPEGCAEDAVLAKVDAEALVFGADEDGGDDVTGDEEQKKSIMEFGVTDGIEDGQENQAASASNGKEDG